MMRDLRSIPGLQVDLRYATTNNFMNRNVYGDFQGAFLHVEAFEKLVRANQFLHSKRPDLCLYVFDALRPRSVQRVLFDFVKGTPQEDYVANPDRGSVHNFGFAIDLSLATADGRLLDMGTDFDDFSELAQPRLERRHLREGRLQVEHLENRALLRDVMASGGFGQLPHEWWHFDALPLRVLRQSYQIVE